jgi:RHS repeat-associated protein
MCKPGRPFVTLCGGYCLILFLCTAGAGPVQTQIQPNRTVPPAGPVKPSLQFSANPTPQEFFQAGVFEEPLVPIGGEPTTAENADLAAALLGYSRRSGPDDFSALTGFLTRHPQSPWAAALLTDLGLEYYNTAHYSLALDAWRQAGEAGKGASDSRGKAIADRAVGELAFMYARLGRMDELDTLLKSIDGRALIGPATQKVVGAREGLWFMKSRPDIAFRCGPLALQSIKHALNPQSPLDMEIFNSASTQKGMSLSQVAGLSQKVGLNYQMAFREPSGAFVLPAVVHWRVGHYAAMVRKQGDLYQLQDPTFGNNTWATKEALETETSCYFLVPPGPLPPGWRTVDDKEGGTVWGKGQTFGNDDRCITKRDLKTCSASGVGMTVPAIHMMTANLSLHDEPLGYSPPVGPPVRLVMRYNHRESFQPANFNYSHFGPKWTCDWISFIIDNPSNVLADVNLYVGGGGERTFTGFDSSTQTFAPQQYDQTLLHRISPTSYELISSDGSKLVFSQPDGAIGTSRRVFLTEMDDAAGNAAFLIYDSDLRIIALVDTIGQVTTLSYEVPGKPYFVTKVTDPFGRVASFEYTNLPVSTGVIDTACTNAPSFFFVSNIFLLKITDVIGLQSRFAYSEELVRGCTFNPTNSAFEPIVRLYTDIITELSTPYGSTSFTLEDLGNNRIAEIAYPDGSVERVEYTQTNNLPPEAPGSVPVGMNCVDANLQFRNTYYWSRTASALGYRDYSKALLFHWLHTENLATTAGALESIKEPLEGRVWFDYPGQISTIAISPTTRPAHLGRVLDDGSTQLYTLGYNSFGRVTNTVDPGGRTLSRIYDTNGIDLLEVRQTRGANNDLLFKATYNSRHRPLTTTDAAGQTTTYTYNARGQGLTVTNPRNEITTFNYDPNGYLLAMDGPLPGTVDTTRMTYDTYGRPRTATSVSGDTFTVDYDNLDRITRITYPDSTFFESTYDLLSLAALRDRAGRLTLFEHNNSGQVTKATDPLGRITLFEWCRCGALKSLTDPMGRTTSWTTDVQGRRIAKLFPDGTQIRYFYENTRSRLREIIDETQQTTFYTYNRDDSLKSITYGNAAIATPPVSFTYDPNYLRPVTMTDGIGTTTYSYLPVTVPPRLGAGNLTSVDGPFANDTIAYAYDGLGRLVQTSINGVSMLDIYDALGRVIMKSNTLGSFSYTYDGGSGRVLSKTFPNGQVTAFAYGDGSQDRALEQITHSAGATPVSQFGYVRDIPAQRITSWSQQAGAQPPSVFSFGYDSVNQLLLATVTNAGTLVNTFDYTYDPAGNRLAEQVGPSNYNAAYTALNQISTTTAPSAVRTNEWDALNRLTAVNIGNQRTEFAYDGMSRLRSIRKLVNASEVSLRKFVWCGGHICEERDASGANVTKRFLPQGVKLETGPHAGVYYYTRDHLGSIREVTDGAGVVRARYTYDPFGRRSKIVGDVDSDFGFAGMFYSSEAALALTRFRVYDPELGRWLSRDPLADAELSQGPNLYAYVDNGPINHTDPLGLFNPEKAVDGAAIGVTAATVYYGAFLPAYDTVSATCLRTPILCIQAGLMAAGSGGSAFAYGMSGPGAEPQVEVACSETTTTAAATTQVMPVPSPLVHANVPEMEPFPGLEMEDGSFLQGEALEAWLEDQGEIPPTEYADGGRTFERWGSYARDLSREANRYEDAFMAANRDLPVDLRLQGAHQYAVERMGGIDPSTWLVGNGVKRWPTH